MSNAKPTWVLALEGYFNDRRKYADCKIDKNDIIEFDIEWADATSIGDILDMYNFQDFRDGRYKVLDNKDNMLKLGRVDDLYVGRLKKDSNDRS